MAGTAQPIISTGGAVSGVYSDFELSDLARAVAARQTAAKLSSMYSMVYESVLCTMQYVYMHACMYIRQNIHSVQVVI